MTDKFVIIQDMTRQEPIEIPTAGAYRKFTPGPYIRELVIQIFDQETGDKIREFLDELESQSETQI